ncbi:MAG: hypothetical protein ACYTGW_12330 [Planctomycetota bacterium]|jgi:hypothetical protein
MTRISALPIAASLLVAGLANAQTDQSPEEQLQAKLASPFLKKAS